MPDRAERGRIEESRSNQRAQSKARRSNLARQRRTRQGRQEVYDQNSLHVNLVFPYVPRVKQTGFIFVTFLLTSLMLF